MTRCRHRELTHDPDAHRTSTSPTIPARAASCASRCSAARSADTPIVGDIIVVSVKEAIPRGRVKKGEVLKAVVVRTAQGRAPSRRHRSSASTRNAAVLINPQGEPIGTRIFGPVTARAARQEPHEDHLARAGGAVDGRQDQEGRPA